MASYPDRRDFPRIPVGPEYTAAFQVESLHFRGVRLTNLNPKGCFALLEGAGPGQLIKDTVLDRFVLEHPDFPQNPFVGSVTYAMENAHEDTSVPCVGLGIRFLGVPEDVEAALFRFLEASLGRPWPS